MHIRYQREIKLFDKIVIESFCVVQKPYLVFQQKILNISTGLASARATTKLIFIDDAKIPYDIPSEIIDGIA